MSFGFQHTPGGASQHPPPSALSNPYAPFPQQPGGPHQPGAPPQPGAPSYQPGAPSFQPGAPPYQPGAPFQPGGPPHQPGAPFQPGAPPHQFGGPPQHQFGGPPQGAPPPYSAPGAPPYQPPPYHPPGSGPQPGFQSGMGQPQYGQERTAVIRNPGSGLVLDGTDYEVKLQRYTGSPAQLWVLEPAGGGKFLIKNKHNGAVIDIEGGPDCGAHLITYEKHGGTNQQWYVNNPDNTIVSAAANLAIDIYEGNCYPGNFVIAYDKHGGPNQQFQLQYQ